MLFRKMFREMRGNLGQFISVMVLSFLATFIYAGFESNVVGSGNAVENFHRETNCADAWIYSEGFKKENLEEVKKLDFVKDAQFRTEVRGTTVDYDGAQLDIYLMDESIILKPYLYKGKEGALDRLKESKSVEFDSEDENGVWLNWSFANEWNISVGDKIKLEYSGVKFERIVRGLIMEPEYEYTKAEKDSDINFKTLAYVYMSYKAFPIREYVQNQVESGKIDAEKLKDSDELIPYSTMLVTFTDDAKKTAAEKIKAEKSSISEAMYYESQISDAIDKNYAVMIDKDSVIGIKRIADELSQHDTFSYAFAFIFLVVAILVISTTMSRLVERQRTQIGTMNALGMKRGKVAVHYMSYSFLVSFIGALAGLIAGPKVVGELIISMVMEWYIIPDVSAGSNVLFYVVAAVVVVVCVLSSYVSCRKLLKVPPAAALRPAAPKKAKRILAERLPFWNKLSFSTQYNMRDVSRAPLRAVMGVVGTAVGTVLVIYAFGCYILVDDVVDWNFEKLQNYGYQMVLSDDKKVEYFDELCDEVDGEMIMTDQIELAKKPNAPSMEKRKQTITVIEGKGLQNITDEKTNITSMIPGKVAITSRLAKEMGVGVGDRIYWHIYSKNDWYMSEIGLINRSPETAGITILREDFERTGCEYVPSFIITNKNIMKYDDREGVAGVYDMEKIKKVFVDGYEVIKYLFYMMMLFSIITVVVVLYNSGNLSFHERLKEFATLKVMGLSTKKIRRILNQENIWFAVLGIIVGSPFGKPSLIAMMNSNGDNFDYYINVPMYLYILSGVFILFVAVAVSMLFSRRIKKLDMVETLKGLE
ncbi:MAG: ABC transporter permease [Lachnospiraceae bacterium]|jgi:putative ABC transport system permease protein|nr:ABC transporter permease [Lachnospiraceae bacterium]